jgi:hypothetical protein
VVKWSEALRRPLSHWCGKRAIGELSKVKSPEKSPSLLYSHDDGYLSLFYRRYTYDENMVMIDHISFLLSCFSASTAMILRTCPVRYIWKRYGGGLRNTLVYC